MKIIRMENMNSKDIKEAINRGFKTVIVAIGSTEQHGPYLPLKTDTLIGDSWAYGVAKKLGKILQAPTIGTGYSAHHLAFCGTISLKPSTLKAIIHDYVESFEKSGFKTVILLPSHGGNFSFVQETINELKNKYTKMKIVGYTDLEEFLNFQMKLASGFGITEEESGAHAGEYETSLLLALSEDLVIKERFSPGYLGPLGKEEVKIILEKGMPALSSTGVLGDPRKSTPERGNAYLEKTIDHIAEVIKNML